MKQCNEDLMLNAIEDLHIHNAIINLKDDNKMTDFNVLMKLLYKNTLNEITIDFLFGGQKLCLRNIKHNYPESSEKRAELIK